MGHVDIATRASSLFDTLIIAVVNNPQKKPALIPLKKRMDLVTQCLGHLPNLSVEVFDGLTVDFAKAHGAQVIIRGLRAVSDFEYEFKMSQMNKRLSRDTETVFMMAGLEYQFLSSSTVKEVAFYGGDISGLVPSQVQAYMETLRQQKASSGKC